MDEPISCFVQHVEALPPCHPARATIVESWQRCLEAKLARDGSVRFRQIPPEELERRLAGAKRLIAVAKDVMERLMARLPGSTNVAYIVDRDGVVLDSVGPRPQREQWGLLPGYDWNERVMGTNGAGTCLVTKRPVVIAGPEHFMNAFEDCTCTAAPIRGPDRKVTGALDVSSVVAEARPDRIELVTAAAEEIERLLAKRG